MFDRKLQPVKGYKTVAIEEQEEEDDDDGYLMVKNLQILKANLQDWMLSWANA